MNFFKLIGLLLAISFTSICNGQKVNSYYKQISNAATLAKEGKYADAIVAYEAAFETVDFVVTPLLKDILAIAKKEKDDLRIEKYETQLLNQTNGTRPDLIPIIDSLYNHEHSVRGWRFKKSYDFYYRCLESETCDKEGRRFKNSEAVINYVDSINLKISLSLLDLMEEHGFIGEKQIGYDNYIQVYIMLVHFDRDTNNRLLQPILSKALEAGSVSPIEYALILDRHSFHQSEQQTFWLWPCGDKRKFNFSEPEIKNIMVQRESIGIYGSEFYQENKKQYWLLRNKLLYY